MARSDSASPSSVNGIRLAAMAAGIRYEGRTDLVLIEACPGSELAATFTRNRFAAAPVKLALDHLPQRDPSRPTFLLINSGNANAGTGQAGLEAAQQCCEAVANTAAVPQANVLPFSTGVIGEALNVDAIRQAVPTLLKKLDSGHWPAAAQGILTTDTVSKQVATEFQLAGKTHRLLGIAKGAGMIKPNMATMLAYLATDANVDAGLLQSILTRAVEQSFNRITVDGDTSTNDACVLLATGQADGLRVSPDNESLTAELQAVVTNACQDLSRQIIRDAEGASKCVTIQVEQGRCEADCLAVAYTVAESPLVKTALFAADPNWGRILAAVGRAPLEQLAIERVTIRVGDELVSENGGLAVGYSEAKAAATMQKDEYIITIALGQGQAHAAVLTSDLSHDYVSINADYRS